MRPEVAQALKDTFVARGLPVPENVLAAIAHGPPPARQIQIAALFVLGASYGQLMTLFGVSTSTIYSSVKRIPPEVRQIRGSAAPKQIISREEVSMYYEAMDKTTEKIDPVKLAAQLREATKGMDYQE